MGTLVETFRGKQMKLTKDKLRQIIKEELKRVLSEIHDQDPMDFASAVHSNLQEIASWMEENGIYDPNKGVEAWLSSGPKQSPRMEQALRDMSEEIYEYMG